MFIFERDEQCKIFSLTSYLGIMVKKKSKSYEYQWKLSTYIRHHSHLHFNVNVIKHKSHRVFYAETLPS